MANRVILFVLDSIGIGALPDSEQFGDFGVNTLKSIATSTQDFKIPNLVKMGLGHIDGIDYIDKTENPTAAFGRLAEISNGKDTTTGHWEIAGLHIEEPFRTYPDGFPEEVMAVFEAKIGRKTYCNLPYSGTTVLDDFGAQHMETGHPIIYTSADSVFQIACHEDVVPLEELYKMCEIARELLRGEHQVARVIARPFVGTPGNFARTSNRHDYSLKPFRPTVLDIAKDAGLDVHAVGKIVDIFDGQGITEDVHTTDNMDGVNKTLEFLKKDSKGILFTNLVDFDSKYGHRRDIEGYKNAIEEFDTRLPEILASLKSDDVIIFTADHGNDPGYKGSDHTREYIPMLVYGDSVKAGVNLGTRKTFADIAATTADILDIKQPEIGESFKSLIL